MTALRRHRRLAAIWASEPGWRGPFSTVNHSDLGRMFLVTAFCFFAIGGLLAMLIRAQLASPQAAFVDAETFSQFFTMHGTIMMFLFAIPAFEGLAIYLLPKMLGTRDLAFPRLTAYGYWCYVFGGGMLIFALLAGLAPQGGWFMYPPLTGPAFAPEINTDFWLIGVTFVEISALAAAVEICVSVLKYRAPGMRLTQMPVFAWYALVTALMILTGFPPLILASVLLELERALGLPFFTPDAGGDSLLWQHLFWMFGHPEVYIIFLPAAGVVSTVLPVMARTPLLGYGWVVGAAVALAFLSFGLWVHHMFTTGLPELGLALFSAASTLVVLPTGVQVFAWIGTLWKGRPGLQLPMLYLLGFFGTFAIGGLTGVMVAIVPFDWQVHDTAFVTAHLHYVLFGGFVFPLLAGLYYWLPLFTGRRRFFRVGELACALIFIGFHVTFLAMHWVGLLGQRRRIPSIDADSGWTLINLISSVGGFVLAIGLAMVLVDVLLHALINTRARRNPWESDGLEWAMVTPAPPYNFASLPQVGSRHPLHANPALPLQLARGEGYLGEPREGRRETLLVQAGDGRPEALVVYPGNSRLPITLAAVTGAAFVGVLLKQWWLLALGLSGVVALAWHWAWPARAVAQDAQPVGGDTALPRSESLARPPGWWGSAFLLVADATFFAALLFGYAFLWTVAPNWPPPQWLAPSLPALGLGLGLGLAGAAGAAAGLRWAWRGGRLLSAAGLLALALAWLLLLRQAPAGSSHAYAGALLVLAGFALLHLGLAALMQLRLALAQRRGRLGAARAGALAIATLWTDFAAGVGALGLAVAYLPPLWQ